MKYTTKEIAVIVGSDSTSHSHTITRVSTDTRTITDGSEVLFIALQGNRDGSRFVMDAYRKGVRCVIVDQAVDDLPKDLFVIQVKDSLEALQSLAKQHRAKYDIPVIAITGSNGKTIVKEWLTSLLAKHYKVCSSPKSYNSQIGVALSLLLLDASHEIAVIEAGISQIGEMQQLAEMIQPTIGIFTNIGDAHSAGFASQAEKIAEKSKLFDTCGTIVYSLDHKEISRYMQLLYGDRNLIAWSHSEGHYQVHTEVANEIIIIKDGHRLVSTTTSMTSKAMLENLGHAAIAALQAGMDGNKLAAAISGLSNVAMRLERSAGIHRSILINDTYNADLTSLRIALEQLRSTAGDRKTTVILSDFDKQHASGSDIKIIQLLLDSSQVDRLITVGQETSKLTAGDRLHFANILSLKEGIRQLQFDQECVLIKGARSYRLDKIYAQLQAQSHTATLTIDLNAISHNLDVYRKIGGSDMAVMPVIKASAYGSGSADVARLLQQKGVDYLAVAFADEGIYLREHGITTPILVLNPDFNQLQDFVDYNLDVELYTMEQIDRVQIEQTINPSLSLRIHIKIDTGMHRLGFNPSDLSIVRTWLETTPGIEVISIFSHLAGSESPEHDDFTRQQVNRYHDALQQLPPAIYYHIHNTAAIVRHPPAAPINMVRIGLGLYGIDSTQEIANQLECSHTLTARIIQIRQALAGESVGYSRAYTAERDTKIVIINIGYADGIFRSLGDNGYTILYHDLKLPIIGRVCMDLIVCALPDGCVAAVGDEVVVFGPSHPIEDMATAAGTIPYEILSRIAPRVQRRYVW